LLVLGEWPFRELSLGREGPLRGRCLSPAAVSLWYAMIVYQVRELQLCTLKTQSRVKLFDHGKTEYEKVWRRMNDNVSMQVADPKARYCSRIELQSKCRKPNRHDDLGATSSDKGRKG
jgi:hypothetical protein